MKTREDPQCKDCKRSWHVMNITHANNFMCGALEEEGWCFQNKERVENCPHHWSIEMTLKELKHRTFFG